MIHASSVLVIQGSVRAGRLCPQIAAWVADTGRAATPHRFEPVDLKDWRLPMDDEPGLPAVHGCSLDHTRAWSRKVAAADAFVFVTPQYNWGYPAALKNALDHLYDEWSGKPAMIVTYGGRGGGKCAKQLRQVLKGLHMKPVAAMPGLRLSHERIKADSGIVEPAREWRDGPLRKAFAQLSAALSPGRGSFRLWPW